jgi:hypothetical protein
MFLVLWISGKSGLAEGGKHQKQVTKLEWAQLSGDRRKGRTSMDTLKAAIDITMRSR